VDDPELGVLVAGAGSSHRPANQLVADVAERWSSRACWAGSVATFAAAADPDVPAAIARLRARGARRFAVASWFLAPGLLPDRIRRAAREHAAAPLIADPMGDDPAVADLVLQRYSAASAITPEYQQAL
jgi:sirohydrochlorin ferrochelatase